MNSILDNEKFEKHCTSCSACFAVCPKDAIEFKLSENGFYRPFVSEEKCVSCGLCKRVCYACDSNVLHDEDTLDFCCVSVQSKDKNILENSSSGGACYELTKVLIDEGYSIIATAYDYEKNEAVGIMFDSLEDFSKIQGSKYFQSNISDALKMCLKHRDKKFAFFGTPCQVYGIRKAINELKLGDKFILVDLFCHGAPTVKLWQKYFDFVKDSLGTDDINRISFRSKAKGWHRFCTTFFYQDKQKTSKIIGDEFYTLFFGKDLFNEACYDCKLRSSLQYTDIRMGDFWGSRYDTDVKGVSCLVSGTENGKRIIEKMDKDCILKTELKFEEVVAAQSYGEVHKIRQKRRALLLDKILDNQTSITEALQLYKRNLSKKEKLVLAKKNFIKAFPLSVSNFAKKIYHKMKY